ncbi:ABC transporter ATP-binding protein/permease [Rhodobacteraceae bacterium ASV31]|nr:ABC transporter ATP-binding protein/permease [Anianabacter salinae]
MILAAFAEIISLGAVLPFVSAIFAPETVAAQPMLAPLIEWFGLQETSDFILAATVLFVGASISAASLRILFLRLSIRFAYLAGADLGHEIFVRTLYQPYEVHGMRNSADVISGITRKVDGVVTGVLLPVLNFCASTLVFCAILTGLILVNWAVALGAITFFGAAYIGITLIVRRRVRIGADHISTEQKGVFKSLNEGLAGIRDVLLAGTQSHFATSFRKSDVSLRLAQADIRYLSQFPRFVLEALAMGTLAIFAYLWVTTAEDPTGALPLFAALAFAGQRMMPALQQGYSAFISAMGSAVILCDVLDLVEQPLPAKFTHVGAPQAPSLRFTQAVTLDGVNYTYPGGAHPVLSDVSLVIPKGTRVGIIGETGSGKSTLVDILLGLLPPKSGHVSIDGTVLTADDLDGWRANISHVPQLVFLSDASFLENIALGEKTEDISRERAYLAARQANLEQAIDRYPEKIDAFVGEAGVNLSGGQRQRLGIARALYRQAQVLVLDEATSALDTATERSVMEAISSLRANLTIIMIAHRHSTLLGCDMILRVAEGKVTNLGTFDEARAYLDV